MRRYHETFRLWEYLLFAVVTLAVLCLCPSGCRACCA